MSFVNSKLADCLSRSVLPRKVPSPVPELELTWLDLDFIYGSPIISFISSGNPGPSSLILICILWLLLIRTISTALFENFTALPIKFLRP